ncbi:hypothetical protein NHF46_21500 [Arthrobacter alpinus]|nr:hypothetical protein [Arthrobacter alpinus]
MVNVPWPMEWTRTYFTPVTVLDGRAHVGPSSVSTRPTRIRNAKVVERVDSQILTFEWPEGADAVMVYTGATGHGPDAAMGDSRKRSHIRDTTSVVVSTSPLSCQQKAVTCIWCQ